MTDITHSIIDCFRTINTIPRCSKNEARISAWLCRWAAAHDLAFRQDRAGNVVIRLPGFPRALAVTLRELRLCGVVSPALEEMPGSGRDLARLLDHYRAQLDEWGLADRAAAWVLRFFAELLQLVS